MRHVLNGIVVVWLAASACGQGAGATASSSSATAAASGPDAEQRARCQARWLPQIESACAAGRDGGGQTGLGGGPVVQIMCRASWVIGDAGKNLHGAGERCVHEAFEYAACVQRAAEGAKQRCETDGKAPGGVRVDPHDAAAVARCQEIWRVGVRDAGAAGYEQQCQGAATRL